MDARGSYKPIKWDEKDVTEIAKNKKITKASVEFSLTGEIDGTASIEYLMYYNYSDPADQHKSDARYLGLMKFAGTINGKSGTFAMEDIGTFANGVADSSLSILRDSGTGDLIGILGNGKYSANQNGASMEITYELKS